MIYNNKSGILLVSFSPVPGSIKFATLLLLLSLFACTNHKYEAQPLDPEKNYHSIVEQDLDSEEFKVFLEMNNYSTRAWPIQRFGLEELSLAALFFNPALKSSLAELAVYDANTGIAQQRQNPGISVPLEHRSEDRDSPWAIGLLANIFIERKQKREARIETSAALARAARLRLEKQAWQLYNEVHQGLVAYSTSIQKLERLKSQKTLLQKALELVERRFELGQASEYEVSSAGLVLQQVELQHANQNSKINANWNALCNRIGIRADKIDRNNIDLNSLNRPAPAYLLDIRESKNQLLNAHYDIQASLEEYLSFEAALKTEIEKQYPDLRLSPGFVFEQGDSIWSLGSSWVLPLFHNNDAQIDKALALRKQKQMEFLALQTYLVSELHARQQYYFDTSASLEYARSLLQQLEEREASLNRQFELGYTDRLALVRSRQQTEVARLAVLAVETDVFKALARLEDIIQKPVDSKLQVKSWISNLANNLPGTN